MKFFTVEELCQSHVATVRGIDNTPGDAERQNMELLIEKVLDPVRQAWGKPIIVNSGYRCEALNRAVGGVKTSQHLTGQAADIRSSDGHNKGLFELIRALNYIGTITFDQLIDESNLSWIHVSYKSAGNRQQVLKL